MTFNPWSRLAASVILALSLVVSQLELNGLAQNPTPAGAANNGTAAAGSASSQVSRMAPPAQPPAPSAAPATQTPAPRDQQPKKRGVLKWILIAAAAGAGAAFALKDRSPVVTVDSLGVGQPQ
jgi:hypothetical protein